MHGYYLSLLQQQFAPLNISMGQILAGSGVHEDQVTDSLTVSPSQLDRICANSAALSGDPQFGLQLGLTVNLVERGIIGYALMTSATVEDALKLLIRYNRPILPSLHIKLRKCEGGAELITSAPELPQELKRAYTEILYAAIMSNGRILIGGARVAPTLTLDYEPEKSRDMYHLIFGDRVVFGADKTSLLFDEINLATPISGANPLSQEIFRRECDRILAIDSHRGSVSERVQQVLLQAGADFPNAAAIASKLNMSESTLQRRLAKEGCRFQQLLDQVRYRVSREYLSGTNLSVAEIAQLLGFSDAANFRRSFKRWSNTTPSMFRSSNTAG
ncbi:MAG: AraC family transcriptional regulator [Gammaproteobacteria bacterium]|nr:AraC family transcriptional regulator [Gammaproteobacteria bacterium]NND39606.1 AraC family transcriptional regulator [Pseudomonadales bacterium]MBT8151578.1 AraC family transcriptional regulator [Gammaproteobacteria bacterium]NNL10322.1 AraC family transcriptional regulator [Pseudomonadales bacterium]NNM11511.1 AraC family transcriptional regulator [Pseudomonadales bacterium]